MKKHLVILLQFLFLESFAFPCEKINCILLKEIQSIQSIPNFDYFISKYDLDLDSCYKLQFTDSNELSITKYYSSNIFQLKIERHVNSNETDIEFRRPEPFKEIHFSYYPEKNGLKIELWDSLALDYYYSDTEGITSFYCNIKKCEHGEYCCFNLLGELTYKKLYIPRNCVKIDDENLESKSIFGYFERSYNLLIDGLEIYYENGVPIKKNLYKAGKFIEEK